MPRAYSTGPPERALAACEAGEGRHSEIARACRVGERPLSGWPKLAREEGRRAPKPQVGGARPVGGAAATPAAPVAERSDATLAEYADLPGAEGARPSAEEKALEAAERDREDVPEARRAWRAGPAGVDPGRLVPVDGTGTDTRVTRACARATRGRRARRRGGAGSG